MPDSDYPDPCEYCPMVYLEGGSYDCRKDCERLEEAARQWAAKEEVINEALGF